MTGERTSSTEGRLPSAAPRPSAPSIPPGTGPAHNGRLLFAFVWIALQAVLVLTASRRVDGAFGFRMFSESSTLIVVLYREVDAPGREPRRERVHVDEGAWHALGADGVRRRLTWYDRVRTPYWVFDREMPASYGAATQIERLQAALDDVATHMPDDGETRRFLLDVSVRRNGREPVLHHLASRERDVRGGP